MTPLTICLIICVLTMISYVWGKLPMALTAMLSMVAFILTGCLDPKTALGYFGNTNGIMIVAMFVVETFAVLYYLPFLIISGVVTGALLGLVGMETQPYLQRHDL